MGVLTPTLISLCPPFSPTRILRKLCEFTNLLDLYKRVFIIIKKYIVSCRLNPKRKLFIKTLIMKQLLLLSSEL